MSVARGLGRAAARLSQSLNAASAKERAAAFGRTLKAEYEAGKAEVEADEGDEGDDTADRAATHDPAAAEATAEADAEAVAHAMRGVDWAKVRAATGEKGAEAAQAMKSMAAEVDWDKVQPVAAKVSSALIAAVASGQLGIGGRFAAPVARAIMNDRNLAQRVSTAMERDTTGRDPLPDFRPVVRGAIDTTSHE